MNVTKEKFKEVYEIVLKAAVTDEEFREALLGNPKSAIENLVGEVLPEDFKLKVVEEEPASEDPDYDMVFYLPPLISDELSEDEMDQVAGGGFGDIVKKTKHIDEGWEKWVEHGCKVLKDK